MKYYFSYLDTFYGIWNCDCFIKNVDKIEVKNIEIGYYNFVKIIINDLIEIMFEGNYIDNSLIQIWEDMNIKGSDKK